jgi:hypothetical protein
VLTRYPCRRLDCEVGVGQVRHFNPKYCSESWPTWGLAVWVKLISRSKAWSPFLSFSLFVFYAPQLVQYALVISLYYFGYGSTLPPPCRFSIIPRYPQLPTSRGLIISIPTSLLNSCFYIGPRVPKDGLILKVGNWMFGLSSGLSCCVVFSGDTSIFEYRVALILRIFPKM